MTLLRICTFLLLIAFANVALTEQAAGASTEDLADTLVELALAANPNLSALTSQIEALEASAEGSRRIKDPMVGVEYSNVPWNSPTLGNSPMSGVQLRVQQTLPAPGVNDARQAASLARVDVREAALSEGQARLAYTVRSGFWRLAYVRAQRQVTVSHIELVAEMRQAVEGRYVAGFVDQSALIRLSLLHDRLEDTLFDHDRDARVLQAGLNAAAARPPQTPIDTPPLNDAVAPTDKTVEMLLDVAKSQRGVLRQYQAEQVAAERMADLAKRQRSPELSVWAGYRLRSNNLADGGADFLTVGFGGTLPFDYAGRYAAEHKQAEHTAEAALHSYDGALDTLTSDLDAAMARWQRANQRASTYANDLIPLGKSALDTTMASFQTGRATFESLYQAEVALLELERALLAARAETWLQSAMVDGLIGTAD